MKTKLISAFPGTGKSHFYNTSNLDVLDSDSSTFDKSNFPQNYIEHIKSNKGKIDIIMISTHEDVRDALVGNKLIFNLVYPERELNEEYIERYKQRGNDGNFVKLLETNWDSWMDELESQKHCKHIRLSKGKFIADLFI